MLGLYVAEVDGDPWDYAPWDYADCWHEIIASSFDDAWKQAKEKLSDRKIIRIKFLKRIK